MSARQTGKNLTRIFDKMIATIVCSKERTLPGPIGGIAARTVRGKDFDGGGGDTGKQYRICAGAATNVCEIDENGRPQAVNPDGVITT